MKGLKPEIRALLRLIRPRGLGESMQLAQMAKDKNTVEHVNRSNSIDFSYQNSMPLLQSTPLGDQKMQMVDLKRDSQRDRDSGARHGVTFKRLMETEIQDKRVKGLCFDVMRNFHKGIDYLATNRTLPRLIDVVNVKSSTKEKVVRVVVLILRNLLPKGNFAAQMIDLGLPQVVQSLKAQAWSDEVREVARFLLGHLDWFPMHKDPLFWRDNITNFEENDFQFIQYHPAGRVIVTDLKAKERVMKLMNHENTEVTKSALLCIQRLFLGAKYASFLQA
ncbi:V-type proton ATPase subunit H [Citrus sinensis]|nr:V-type proton ATPase subunit H [Citrus sinensis]